MTYQKANLIKQAMALLGYRATIVMTTKSMNNGEVIGSHTKPTGFSVILGENPSCKNGVCVIGRLESS